MEQALTQEKIAELKKLSFPLMKFLCKNFHPHVKIIVTQTTAEFLEGLCSVYTSEFLTSDLEKRKSFCPTADLNDQDDEIG